MALRRGDAYTARGRYAAGTGLRGGDEASAMVHDLYIGHFEHDGHCGRIRVERVAGGRRATLVMARPLDWGVVEATLRAVGGNDVALSSIPRGWRLRVAQQGYLVCDHYTRSRRAIEFVIRLARKTGCQLINSNLFPLVSVESLERRLGLPVKWAD